MVHKFEIGGKFAGNSGSVDGDRTTTVSISGSNKGRKKAEQRLEKGQETHCIVYVYIGVELVFLLL